MRIQDPNSSHWSMAQPIDKLYEEFKPCRWDNIKSGDLVYVDHYRKGVFPDADPRITGPFVVVSIESRTLKTVREAEKYVSRFVHFPNNLLQKVSQKAF
jgi:hypothetical protein